MNDVNKNIYLEEEEDVFSEETSMLQLAVKRKTAQIWAYYATIIENGQENIKCAELH